MAFTIAVSGKGGTGKTTIASLVIRYIIEKKKKPVLAVDADSNSCLNETLGVKVHATIGKIREDSLHGIRNGSERPGGMSLEQIFDYQIQQSITEAKDFDLIVMGRPEGPGCYCAANNIIRKYIDKLSDTYPYVVIDNEAGMEHLSRRTTHRVNLLLILSDPSFRGIQTANRIDTLINELQIEIDRRVMIINKISEKEGMELKKSAEGFGLNIAGFIPNDDTIFHFDLQGKPTFQLPEDSKATRALFAILDSLHIP